MSSAKQATRQLARRIIRGPRLGQQWARVEMDRAVDAFLTELDPRSCDAFEISGNGHQGRAWRSYLDLWYPDFDLLDPAPIGEFDVVICEQVLEHVTEPWQSMQTLAKLCKPGGHVIITTPFMLRIRVPARPLAVHPRRYGRSRQVSGPRGRGIRVVGQHVVHRRQPQELGSLSTVAPPAQPLHAGQRPGEPAGRVDLRTKAGRHLLSTGPGSTRLDPIDLY